MDEDDHLIAAVSEQEARLTRLKQIRGQKNYPFELFEVPVILDHQLKYFEDFLVDSIDPRAMRVGYLALVGLVSEFRFEIEKEGPLGTKGISAFNLPDPAVVRTLNKIREKDPLPLIDTLHNTLKHARASAEKELKVDIRLEPTKTVSIRFAGELIAEWRQRSQKRVISMNGYDTGSLVDLFRDASKTVQQELDAVAKTMGVHVDVAAHQNLLREIFTDELAAWGIS